ncbi:E3 ubiquitin-protein ligase RNF216 [Aspergillus ibericus CBS 121593]|uniref:RING-type domain-containing protein n=1 Tax=Aspergillus ibericus CBS 121593 TaxID=1448316 RepID=A0A395HES1_9EURO|nr:hypothetical protein BO80DRAFT_441592 [Aspergillus ibericus CBS 121593]RAL04734.1 hypothetical protein BO80DRAFT_441592 [Aspergillus ibericus CBS 121593]
MEFPHFNGPMHPALPLRLGYLNGDNLDLPYNDNPALAELNHWDIATNDLDWNTIAPPFPFSDYDNPMKKQKQSSTSTIGRELGAFSLGSGSTSASSHSGTQHGAVFIDLTEDDAVLTHILDIFPDISHNYVEELINRHKGSHGKSIEQELLKENVVEEIVQQSDYPKQEKVKKRKIAETEDEDKKWMANMPERGSRLYLQLAIGMLSQEFGWIPLHHIRHVVNEKKELFSAFLTLHTQELGRTNDYIKLKRERISVAKTDDGSSIVENLHQELAAAKKRAAKDDGEWHSFDNENPITDQWVTCKAVLRRQKEDQEAEVRNEEEHTRTGNLVECQCCYLDVPANRSLPCEGDYVHFFCFTCIRKSAETQIGLMKYQLQCFDTSGCQAQFSRARLGEALGPSMMEKLDSLQQQDEIEKAGLEGLEACPFCDFKAICPPVEEDREFRCRKPECERVSCRLCQQESHIPRTCQEAKLERGLPERHLVEEAMSEALIRNCPRCKVKIVKEYGCNKMICSKCRCAMCYVCKKDISQEQYDHFGRPPTNCRTHDEPAENRSLREIEQAQKATIETLLAQNPELTEEELRVHTDKEKKPASNQQRRNNYPRAELYQNQAWGNARQARVVQDPRQRLNIPADLPARPMLLMDHVQHQFQELHRPRIEPFPRVEPFPLPPQPMGAGDGLVRPGNEYQAILAEYQARRVREYQNNPALAGLFRDDALPNREQNPAPAANERRPHPHYMAAFNGFPLRPNDYGTYPLP